MIANFNLSNALIASITLSGVANALPQGGPLDYSDKPAPSLIDPGPGMPIIKGIYTYNPASDKPAPTQHVSDTTPAPHPTIIINTKPLPSATTYDDGQ